MSTPILQTKLYIPRPTQTHIVRPDLIRVLEDGCQPGCQLILEDLLETSGDVIRHDPEKLAGLIAGIISDGSLQA